MKSVSVLTVSVCAVLFSILPATAQKVGISAAVNQSARGIQPGSSVRTIVIGDNVVYNERIETDPVGLLQILLADGTTFTVGPNSALSIDRFVYDPAAGTAQVTASLTKGVFRFIGGKASKTPGGVQLNTPVGTIGIRGATADIRLRTNKGEFALTYGKELTLESPDGERSRAYKQGFSIIATKNADGSVTSEIRRTPSGFTKEVQQSISGRPGTNGGTSNPLGESQVRTSGVSKDNSDQSPITNLRRELAAIRDDRQTSGLSEEAVRTATSEDARTSITATATDSGSGSPPVQEPAPSKVVRLSVLTAGSTYVTEDEDVIDDPGLYGLVGGSPETDLATSLVQANGSTIASGPHPRGSLVLPIYADDSFTTHEIGLSAGASLGGVPLSGFAHSNADDFTAYTLAVNGDRTNPVYALKGTPTSDLSLVQDGDIRTYAFTEDFLQELRVPFMRSGGLDTDYRAASVTPFYIAEKDGVSAPGTTKLFQSWLLIEGQGASQKSAIGVNAGRFFDSDGYQTAFSHRGSYRADALSASNALTGGTISVGGPDGGNHLFGTNAQNLVLGYDYQNADVFGDPSAFRGGTLDFGTFHVLSLTDEVTADQFAQTNGATRALGAGSNTTINGFATGVTEGRDIDGSRFVFNAASSSNVGDMTLTFNRAARSLGGEIQVSSSANDRIDQTRIAFGDGINGNNAGGSSALINDDLFAAHHNSSETRSRIRRTDENGVVSTLSLVPDDSAKTYVVSGDANPQPNLLPDGKMCDCAFLEWGWWGTQIRAQNPSGTPGVEGFREGVHLGNWVAGDVTSAAELSNSTLANATYQGHALGTVVTANGSDVGRYIASGDMSMSWNFASGTGTMSISSFDGRDLTSGTGGLVSTNVAGAATFGGSLSEFGSVSNGADGTINGAFVNGATIAKGVIGNMNVSTPNGDWSAVGIIAGAR